ncbi:MULTISPECIES: hypothetical protein [Vallitalea]|uniref:Uncharacterized protein n=1 Tax=Vallitalea maricola TaxID=3074433 RepID=A0ACB5UE15_9FIRM|nr:hypothetical protein [Vallitalea guaymasensis]GMQ61182.1 hypothetical protein AN2V17_04100 [Vallitalea sp. AN17-2]
MKLICPHCGKEFDYKPKKRKTKTFDIDSKEYELALYLKNSILGSNPYAKVPSDLNKWAIGFDRLLRLDNRQVEATKEIIAYAHSNNFWQGNILSPEAVRRNYDKLTIQMNNSKKPKQGNSNFNNMVDTLQNWG